MNNKERIIEKINNLLKEFPLKENAEILPDKKLSEIINIFNSILAERVKSKLYDYFPKVNFEKLTEMSTINEIYQLILNDKNYKFIDDPRENSLYKEIKNINENSRIIENLSESLVNHQQSIGIDIEKRNSIGEDIFDLKLNSFRNRIFTTEELIYSISKSDPILSLVGIFSAKESVKKALGCEPKIKYQQIKIKHGTNGKPYADVIGYENNQFLISISHTDEFVISICILNL
jgi:phosphopantetheine--protein transferase-like protein